MSRSLIIIPTFNEKENISDIIQVVLNLNSDYSVLIVDDNSPDGTAIIVADLQKDYPDRLFLLERRKKLGLGTAYIKGFLFGVERKFDCIVEMDADFSHDPEKLPGLISLVSSGQCDVSIGSRYIQGGGIQNWPKDRLFLSRGASIYVRCLTGMRVKDPTSGFVCYSRRVLESIDLNKIRFVGYAFQIEMKYASRSLGFKLKELPIIFKDRVKGNSKMNLSIVKEAILGVIQIRFRSFFYRAYYRKS